MIVFVSNFMNHHQFGVAQELFKLTNGDYKFIEMEQMPESFKKAGYPDFSKFEFVCKAWESEENQIKAKEYIDQAEVVVFGGLQCRNILNNRIKNNKLTFEYGERWLKRGLLNLLSPNLLKALWYYKIKWKNKPVYYLCAGAYVAKDLKFLGTFKNKCFKYGYFPYLIENKNTCNSKEYKKIKLISVSRLINWKRIDLGIKAAKCLKEKGYNFIYNIYGSGPLKNKYEKLIRKKGLQEYVFLKGNIPNEEIQKEMAQSDIFIFPSNRREGWGAVLNEAMYNKCAIIASDKIGAVPYLIKDKENGLIFKEGSVKDLFLKIEFLINNPKRINQLSENAFLFIKQYWSPEKVANTLLKCFNNSLNKTEYKIKEGPLSPA